MATDMNISLRLSLCIDRFTRAVMAAEWSLKAFIAEYRWINYSVATGRTALSDWMRP